MLRHFLLLYLLVLGTTTSAQEPQTIRVRRESNLAKAVLDNTENKLVTIDRFGNPKENKIMSYKLFVQTSKETVSFHGYSNNLTPEMISFLNKQKKASKLFFTEISALDENEHLVKLPDLIETWFPECGNCDRQPRKR